MRTNQRWKAWRRAGLMLLVGGGLLTAFTVALLGGQIAPVLAQGTELNLAFDAYTTREGAANLIVTATVEPPSTDAITVTFSTTNDSAEAPDDYTGLRRRLTIPPGTTTFTTEVPIVDDELVEGIETFEVGLSIAQNATLGDRITATVAISDNDEARLRIEDITAWESDGTATVTVTQSSLSTLHTSFNIFTTDDTATAGDDYVAVPASTALDIPPGEQSASLNITLLDDDVAGSNKQFFVSLEDPLNSTIARGTATVTLIDEDALPALSIADAAAREDDGSMRFTLTLDEAADMTVRVDYQTVNDSAVAPDDYAVTSGQLVIPTGTTTAGITVPLVDDNQDEGNERFHLTLSDPVATTLTTNQATGTIQDDDQAQNTNIRLYLPEIVIE